jgi:uncharacterized membrane protein
MGSQRDVARAREPAETRAILLFASAEFLDVATTLIGLRSGRFREGNPVAAKLLARTDLLMVLKLLVVMAVLLLVHRFVSPGRRAGALMVMATIAMAAPILNVAHLLAGG